jgi:outer membrane immunogenic protein
MKKKRAALTGLAALTLFDLVGAQAQAQAPVFNWTGFYVGAHTGYRWGVFDGSIPAGSPESDAGQVFPFSTSAGSGIFGFHAGYNYQVSPDILVGIETGWSWGRGTANVNVVSDINDAFATVNYRLQLTWSGSVRGRLGLVANEWLFYGTGGIAFQHLKVSGTGFVTDSFGFVNSSLSQGKVLYGYVVGVGVERYAVGGWTWRIEYLFADFGSTNFGRANLSGEFTGDSFSSVSSTPLTVDLQTHTIRVGITKLFQP